jgi:hypothetical protein
MGLRCQWERCCGSGLGRDRGKSSHRVSRGDTESTEGREETPRAQPRMAVPQKRCCGSGLGRDRGKSSHRGSRGDAENTEGRQETPRAQPRMAVLQKRCCGSGLGRDQGAGSHRGSRGDTEGTLRQERSGQAEDAEKRPEREEWKPQEHSPLTKILSGEQKWLCRRRRGRADSGWR